MRAFVYILLFVSTFVSGMTPAQAKGEEAFLSLKRDFVFDAVTGHRILYSAASNNFTFFDQAGEVLASGQPFRMIEPNSQHGYFEHSFTLTDLDGNQYALAIATKLHRRVQAEGLLVPTDTKFIVAGGFLLVPFDETTDILRAELIDPLHKVRSIVNRPGPNCRAVFH